MARARADRLRVALRLEDLDDAQQHAVRAALADLDVEVTEDEAAVTIAGPSPPLVAALGARLVVAVLPTPDRPATTELLSAGASAVLMLDELGTTLEAAVQAAAVGLVVVSAQERDALRRPTLTAREREVLSLVVMGLTNAVIGQRLYLAESTVKYHLFSIYGKLGVRTRQEATDLALDPRNGLTGVLGLSGARRARRGAYSEPEIG